MYITGSGFGSAISSPGEPDPFPDPYLDPQISCKPPG